MATSAQSGVRRRSIKQWNTRTTWWWRYVLADTVVRYREPYHARQTFISWSIMIGKNLLKLAQEEEHRLQTLSSPYAAWTKDAKQADVALIRQAMENSPRSPAPSGAAQIHRKRRALASMTPHLKCTR